MLVVVALGGNALMRKGERSFDAQFKNAEKVFRSILPLTKQRLVITHGNGPQVGNIMIRNEEALGKAYPLPLYAAVAESEGEIGFVLSQVLGSLKKPVVSVLTRVLVDAKDPAFRNPTKPIGPFYTRSQAARLKRRFRVAKVHGGWRRVVASPKPLHILEAETIRRLAGHALVIAAGGGIPVVRRRGKMRGIDAVIDKDLASACLAKSLRAGMLLMLTDVGCAYLNYGKRNQQPLGRIKAAEARKYISEGHFEEGSMLPKMLAAADFAEGGGTSVITSFAAAKKALRGKAGTVVTG